MRNTSLTEEWGLETEKKRTAVRAAKEAIAVNPHLARLDTVDTQLELEQFVNWMALLVPD